MGTVVMLAVVVILVVVAVIVVVVAFWAVKLVCIFLKNIVVWFLCFPMSALVVWAVEVSVVAVATGFSGFARGEVSIEVLFVGFVRGEETFEVLFVSFVRGAESIEVLFSGFARGEESIEVPFIGLVHGAEALILGPFGHGYPSRSRSRFRLVGNSISIVNERIHVSRAVDGRLAFSMEAHSVFLCELPF